jgi:hypothetical protein
MVGCPAPGTGRPPIRHSDCLPDGGVEEEEEGSMMFISIFGICSATITEYMPKIDCVKHLEGP